MNTSSQQVILRFSKRRVIIVISTLFVLALVSVAVGRTIRARMQAASARTQKDALVAQIEKSLDFSLRIQQDEDTPLKILEAKVKEISAADCEKLTSIKSDLPLIVSAPEVRMLNVSTKTINRIMLFVSDGSGQRSTGVMMHDLSITPGAAFTIVPANFVKPETLTAVDENGKASSSVKAAMKSKSFWLPFADKSQLQVRLGVEFQDGTKWFNRGQRGEGQ